MFFDNAGVEESDMQAVLKLIGARIEELREQKKWSQRGVADSAKITLTQYAAIARAERYYGIDSLIRVLGVFDIDIMDLFKEQRPNRKAKKPDPLRRLALEQIAEFIALATDAEMQAAAWSIQRWHRALPPKK